MFTWFLSDGYLRSLDPSDDDDAELLLAIPRAFGVYTRNPSYVIHASPGAIVHLNGKSGSLQAHGTGNIMVHACYDLSRLQSLLHLRPLDAGGRVEVKVQPEDGESAKCLVVSSSSSVGRAKAPVKVVLIPIGQTRDDEVQVRVGMGGLIRGLGPSDQVALVAGKADDVRFLQTSSDDSYTFVVPKHGGEFLLSPIYDFHSSQKTDDSTDECRISFLTPHSDVTYAQEGLIALPTPPPSPHIPMLKRQVSFAKKAEVIPSTPPSSHTPQQDSQAGALPARELRRRHQASSTIAAAISPSTSDESALSSTAEPESRPTTSKKESQSKQSMDPRPRPQVANLFALISLFAWIRTLLILVRFVVGMGLRRQQQKKEVRAIENVEEKHVLQDFSQEEVHEEEEEAEGNEPSSSSVSSESISELSDVEEPMQEIHAPKPSFPSTQNTTSRGGKPIRVLYADLCLPSPSPFATSSVLKSEASLILSVKGTERTGTSSSMSSLGKILTVNGEVPADLDVTPLFVKNGTEEGHAIGPFASYLVRFSLPLSNGAADGARLRIAETSVQ